MLDRRQTRLALLVEWLAAAAVIGFWTWQAWVRPHPITYTLGVGSAAFVVTWLVVLHRPKICFCSSPANAQADAKRKKATIQRVTACSRDRPGRPSAW